MKWACLCRFLLDTADMSTPATDATVTPSPSSETIAAEVRAHLARRGMSLTAFEQLLGVPKLWAIRRIGPSRSVDPTIEDLSLIASALEVPLAELLVS